MGKFKDLTGEKFGRLYVQYIKGKTKDNKRYIYHCICDCGNECDKLGELLSNGKTKSCGCLRSETVSKNHKKYNQYDLSNDYGIGYTSKGEKFYFDIDDYEKIKNDYWYYCNNYVENASLLSFDELENIIKEQQEQEQEEDDNDEILNEI